MKYIELKTKHQTDLNQFPLKFAFSDKQFQSILDDFNITKDEAPDKLISIGSGGFLLKTDFLAFKEMIQNHDDEMNKSMLDDAFLINAIEYELGNHEYCITYDESDTVYALNLDMENNRIQKCFSIARKNYLQYANA